MRKKNIYKDGLVLSSKHKTTLKIYNFMNYYMASRPNINSVFLKHAVFFFHKGIGPRHELIPV